MGKKKKKNKGGTGSEYFDYRYGVGEAKHMMERYGVEGAASYAPDGRSMGKTGMRSADDVKDDIAKAMMNDYDTRRSMEAAALLGNKDAKKYAKNGFKGKNIQDAYGVMRDLKKEYVGGGGMSGAENIAGLTHALVSADRDSLLERIAENATPEVAPDPPKGFTYEGADKEISPEMQAAQDTVESWENSASGGTTPNPYGGGDSIFSDAASQVYGADDQQTQASVVADSTDPDQQAAQSYLDNFKAKLKEDRNFTRDF